MVKSVKKVLFMFLGIMAVIIPLNVLAANYSISIDCDSEKIKYGNKSQCSIWGDSTTFVKGLQFNITFGTNLSKASTFLVPTEAWKINQSENDTYVQMATNRNLTGNFKIADIYFTGIKQNYDTNIKLSSIVMTDDNLQTHNLTDLTKNIRIMSSENNLEKLTIDGNEISPFTGNTTVVYDYETDKETIFVNARAKDSNATITGDIGNLNLKVGQNVFTIYVAAEDGTIKTHSLNVKRIAKNDEIWNKFIDEFKKTSIVNSLKEAGFTVNIVSTNSNLEIELSDDNNYWFTEFTYADGILTYVPSTDDEDLQADSTWIINSIYALSNIKGYNVDKLIEWLDGNDNVKLDKDGIEFTTKDIVLTENNEIVDITANTQIFTKYKLDIKNGIMTYKESNNEQTVSNDPTIENPKTGAFISIVLLVGILGGSTYVIHNLKKKNKFNN